MKRFLFSLLFSLAIGIICLLLALMDKSLSLFFYIPFITFGFMSPQSYLFFIKDIKIFEKTKTDYGVFLWIFLPYILSPVGFILFAKKTLNKN